MDFNRHYFAPQVRLIKADGAATLALRRDHENEASLIAGRIREKQANLGAAAACAWIARECEPAA